MLNGRSDCGHTDQPETINKARIFDEKVPIFVFDRSFHYIGNGSGRDADERGDSELLK